MKKFRKWASILGIMGLVACSACLTSACKKEEETTEGYIEQESETYETLSESNAEKFSYGDLTVDKLKMGMTEEAVKAILGEPSNYYNSEEVVSATTSATQSQTQSATKGSTDEILDEKIYTYSDLSLIFMKVDGSYKLCAAASTGDAAVFARGIKVGDKKDKIFELFYRDSNCLNQNLMTEDNETIIGKYLYGDFTIDNLEKVKTNQKIQYGVINYNGYTSMEDAESYIIEFTYFEPPYKGESATYNDDFAQMAFDIDGNDIITGIRWYYYPEADNSN